MRKIEQYVLNFLVLFLGSSSGSDDENNRETKDLERKRRKSKKNLCIQETLLECTKIKLAAKKKADEAKLAKMNELISLYKSSVKQDRHASDSSSSE